MIIEILIKLIFQMRMKRKEKGLVDYNVEWVVDSGQIEYAHPHLRATGGIRKPHTENTVYEKYLQQLRK